MREERVLLKKNAAITSYDIARAAGVSQPTVSRVLHNNSKVKPDTRERVLQTIQDLEYAPDGLARAMVTRRMGTIGAVVEDITNPFYPEVVEALCSEFAAVNHRMTLWNSGEAGEPSAVEAIKQRLIDGVVFTTALPSSIALAEAVRKGLPIVLVNRHVEGIECDRVTTDNITGGRLIANYFADWGHERIGLITGIEQASTSIEREMGFLEGLEARSQELDPALRLVGSFSHRRSYEAMTEMMKLPNPPTAVFCVNDVMAFGALNAARALRIRVPEDIWIVGFDDIDMASWETFGLTTVSQPINEMVHEAVRLLLNRIDKPDRAPEHLRLGGSEIIVRGSTAHKPPETHQAVHPPSTKSV